MAREPLSVVIVSYESASELPAALRSLLEACDPSDQILVVDNASTDASVEIARGFSPRVTVIVNDANRGFAAAANQGVRASTAPLCLLLNPDTVASREAVDELIACLERHGPNAIVGPRLLNADGSTQRSAFRFPTPRVLLIEQANLAGRWPGFDQAAEARDDVEVDWLKGACILSRTSLLLAHGPFDEGFFMFGEDVDLCHRLHDEGAVVVHCPYARVVHLGGMSTRRDERSAVLGFVTSNYRLYARMGWNDRLPAAALVIRLTALAKGVRAVWSAAAASLSARPAERAREVQVIGTLVRAIAVPSRPPTRTPASIRVTPSKVVRSNRALDEGPPSTGGPVSRSTAARGSFAVLVSFAAIALLNYGFAVAMSWLLPVEGYGVLGVAQAILLITATVVSAGFPWALAQRIARTHDRDERASAFRSGFASNLVLGAIIGLMVGGLGLSGLVRPTDAYGPALIIVGVTTALLASNAILTSTLQGTLRLIGLASVRAFEVLIKAIAGVLLVVLGLGTSGAVLGFLVGAAAATALAAWLLRDLPLFRGQGWRDRQLLGAAGPLFVGMAGFALLSQLDILTVKVFSEATRADALAGQYQVALTLARIPFFAAMALFGAIFPYVASDFGSSDVGRAYARLALKYTVLFLVPISLALMIIPDPMIRLFFSEKYDQSAGPLAYAAAASSILGLAYGISILLQAQGRAGRPAVALAVAVPVQFVVAAITVPTLGMAGAALGLGVAATLVVLLLGPAAIQGFRLRPTVSEMVRYVAALAIPSAVVTVLPHGDRLTTTATLVVAAVVYGIAIVILGLVSARDVEIIGSAVGSRGTRVRRRLVRLIDTMHPRPAR